VNAGGPHLDAGVHHTALIRLLCGDVRRVYGETQDANSTHGGPSDLTLNMKFVNGAIGNYTASYPELEVPREPNDLRIYGTDGVLSLYRGQVRIDRPGEPAMLHRPNQTDWGHYNAFVNFHDAVRHDAPVLGTVTETFRNMQIVLDGLASADSGCAIEIDPFPTELLERPLALWTSLRPDPLFADPAYVIREVAAES
jgi:predicted dehydrogenase